jgi:hypothetical protein
MIVINIERRQTELMLALTVWMAETTEIYTHLSPKGFNKIRLLRITWKYRQVHIAAHNGRLYAPFSHDIWEICAPGVYIRKLCTIFQ